MASPQFHVVHNDLFETTGYNRSSAQTKIKRQQLSGINLEVTLDKRDNIKRSALTIVSAANANATAGKSPAVANLTPMFEHRHTTSLEEEGTFAQVTSPPVQAPQSSVLSPAVAPVPNVPDISSRGRHRIATKIHNVHAFKSTFETQHDIYTDLQDSMRSFIALLSETNVDTMYFHQDIKPGGQC